MRLTRHPELVGRAAILALTVVVLASPASHAAAPEPIIYGYPYASRCPAAGLANVVDRWHMYACNCTSYVAWALAANGQRVDWFVPGSMDAWNWPNVARRGRLRVDRVPAIGAVVAWPRLARPFGHVAYVTAIDSGGRIDVAEYNLPVFGQKTFTFDTRENVSAAGAVFIHVPRRAAPQP